MYIVLVGLTGILNVVVFKEFDWESLMKMSYWTPIAINNVFYFSAFIITVMLVYDILEYKDLNFVSIEKDIHDERDKLVADEFKQHITNYNFMEKKNIWFQFVNVWLGNLQSKLKHKVATQMKTKTKDWWGWRAKRYVYKKERLMEFKRKEWVDNNLLFRKKLGWGWLGFLKPLHYPEITINEIIYGTTSLKPKKSALERHILRGQIIQKSFATAISIMLSVVSNLMQVDRWLSTISIIIAIAIMLITILINVVMGVIAGFRAHKIRVENATIRLGKVVDYINGKRYPQAPIIDYVPDKVIEKQKDVDDVPQSTPQFQTAIATEH
jgi:hypothetical protein